MNFSDKIEDNNGKIMKLDKEHRKSIHKIRKLENQNLKSDEQGRERDEKFAFLESRIHALENRFRDEDDQNIPSKKRRLEGQFEGDGGSKLYIINQLKQKIYEAECKTISLEEISDATIKKLKRERTDLMNVIQLCEHGCTIPPNLSKPTEYMEDEPTFVSTCDLTNDTDIESRIKEEAEIRNSDLVKMLSKEQGKVSSLEKKLKAKEESHSKSEEKNNTVIKEKSEELQKYAEMVRDLKNDLSKIEKKYSEIKESRAVIEADLESKNETIDRHKDEILYFNESLLKIERTNSEVEKHYKEDLTSQKNTNQELKMEIAELNKKHRDFEKTFVKQLDKTLSEMNKLKDEKDQLRDKVRTINSTNRSLKRELLRNECNFKRKIDRTKDLYSRRESTTRHKYEDLRSVIVQKDGVVSARIQQRLKDELRIDMEMSADKTSLESTKGNKADALGGFCPKHEHSENSEFFEEIEAYLNDYNSIVDLADSPLATSCVSTIQASSLPTVTIPLPSLSLGGLKLRPVEQLQAQFLEKKEESYIQPHSVKSEDYIDWSGQEGMLHETDDSTYLVENLNPEEHKHTELGLGLGEKTYMASQESESTDIKLESGVSFGYRSHNPLRSWRPAQKLFTEYERDMLSCAVKNEFEAKASNVEESKDETKCPW